MTLSEIKEILDATVCAGNEKLDMEIKIAFAADLMSDVLAFTFAKEGSLLITGLTNPQIIRTAYTIDIAAVMLVRGKIPPEETIRLARELDIPLLSTEYTLFEASGRLYAKGIVGCIEKVKVG